MSFVHAAGTAQLCLFCGGTVSAHSVTTCLLLTPLLQGAFAHIVVSLHKELNNDHHNNGNGHHHHHNTYSSHHNDHRDARGLPFSGIFAVGDNPAADVRGANLAGPPWVSVLVRTGGCGWVRYKGGVHVQSAMTLQGQLELRSSS